MSDEQEPYDPTSMEGVPEHGRERLERMRDRSLFTSDLTVNEFLLVRAAGFEPLGLVVGTSIYHIGFQMGAWSRNQEMDVLTQAMYHARELAMTRMEEEADQLGADGIVAVRLEVSRRAWGNDLAEFVAIGTAVRSSASASVGVHGLSIPRGRMNDATKRFSSSRTTSGSPITEVNCSRCCSKEEATRRNPPFSGSR